MLPRTHRLGRIEVEMVMKRGRSLFSPSLGLKVLKREGDVPSRFAFVVSNKVGTTAPKRNYLKRIMRESVRRRYPLIKNGFDVAIMAQKPASSFKYKEMDENILGVLTRAGLI